ncbi:MAG: short-chain dehydrogenase/reductase [Cytophagaceae bacterium]|nr:short-chain dehydrogenase/reductase [Cytophagaceae bacterium]
MKTVLVTGASSGIGKSTAIYLAQNGYKVYGAARRIDKLRALETYGIKPISLDVTQQESAETCINQILKEEGKIDVLVNNAGAGFYGALEDVPLQDGRNMLDVNLFGVLRLIQKVLPNMRKNKSGKIVNISSIGGKIGMPMGGWYSAGKFAIEGVSDVLRNEVKQFGIDVIVIEPGGTNSEMEGKGMGFLKKVSENSAYKNLSDGLIKMYSDIKASDPIVIAKLIRKSIEAKHPKTRYAGGAMAKPMLFMRKILSDKLFDKMLMSQFK